MFIGLFRCMSVQTSRLMGVSGEEANAWSGGSGVRFDWSSWCEDPVVDAEVNPGVINAPVQSLSEKRTGGQQYSNPIVQFRHASGISPGRRIPRPGAPRLSRLAFSKATLLG